MHPQSEQQGHDTDETGAAGKGKYTNCSWYKIPISGKGEFRFPRHYLFIYIITYATIFAGISDLSRVYKADDDVNTLATMALACSNVDADQRTKPLVLVVPVQAPADKDHGNGTRTPNTECRWALIPNPKHG